MFLSYNNNDIKCSVIFNTHRLRSLAKLSLKLQKSNNIYIYNNSCIFIKFQKRKKKAKLHIFYTQKNLSNPAENFVENQFQYLMHQVLIVNCVCVCVCMCTFMICFILYFNRILQNVLYCTIRYFIKFSLFIMYWYSVCVQLFYLYN